MGGTPNLVTLRPGLTLEAEAAASWARMEAQHGGELDVNSSYRDYDEQMKAFDAWNAYQAGTGPKAPLALDPADSWHCRGLACDTDDTSTVQSMPDHGWRFVVASEVWHAQYYPGLDRYRGSGFPADSGFTPLPDTPIKKESDMSAFSQAGVPDSGIIVRGVEAPNARPRQIYDAARGALSLEDKVLAEWQYKTAVNEQWIAFELDKRLRNSGVDTDDVDAVIDEVKRLYPPIPNPAE